MSLSEKLYLEGKANTSLGTGLLCSLDELPKSATYFGSDDIFVNGKEVYAGCYFDDENVLYIVIE